MKYLILYQYKEIFLYTLYRNMTTESLQKTKTRAKTFKEKYNTDPIFRERQKRYMIQKIPCICGAMITRVNIQRHKLSKKHIEYCKSKKPKDITDKQIDVKIKDRMMKELDRIDLLEIEKNLTKNLTKKH